MKQLLDKDFYHEFPHMTYIEGIFVDLVPGDNRFAPLIGLTLKGPAKGPKLPLAVVHQKHGVQSLTLHLPGHVVKVMGAWKK